MQWQYMYKQEALRCSSLIWANNFENLLGKPNCLTLWVQIENRNITFAGIFGIEKARQSVHV